MCRLTAKIGVTRLLFEVFFFFGGGAGGRGLRLLALASCACATRSLRPNVRSGCLQHYSGLLGAVTRVPPARETNGKMTIVSSGFVFCPLGYERSDRDSRTDIDSDHSVLNALQYTSQWTMPRVLACSSCGSSPMRLVTRFAHASRILLYAMLRLVLSYGRVGASGVRRAAWQSGSKNDFI